MAEYQFLQVTTAMDSRDLATELARSAVGARVAACAQVLGPVASIYWWDDGVESASEWLVLFKTTAERYPDLEAHIRGRHPYDVPEILATPIVTGHRPYLQWVRTETAGDAAARQPDQAAEYR